MKFAKPYIAIVVVLAGCSINRLEKKGIYSEVSPQEFAELAEGSSIQIIDVRTPSEYRKSHIKGAVNISYFGDFKDSLKNTSLDTSEAVYIYCETQHRSLFAAKILYKKGFSTIVDLDKGMRFYRKNGLPFIADSTEAGSP